MAIESGLFGISWPWKVFPVWQENDVLISQAINDVIMTYIGERKMNMNHGSEVIGLVFENKGIIMSSLAKREISVAIGQNIPYVRVLNIDVIEGEEDTDPVVVDVEWEYLGSTGLTSVEIPKV